MSVKPGSCLRRCMVGFRINEIEKMFRRGSFGNVVGPNIVAPNVVMPNVVILRRVESRKAMDRGWAIHGECLFELASAT